MSRLPTTAFESQAQAINNRMLGVKATIDEMMSTMSLAPPLSPVSGSTTRGRTGSNNSQLLELAPLMEQFCEVQDKLQHVLTDATAHVARVQQRLAVTLSSCEQFATGLASNLKRMMGGGGGAGAGSGVDDDATMSSSRELLLLHTHAVSIFSEVLNMPDPDDQEAVLRENADLFDERDRLMSQFTLQSQAASQPRETPSRSEKTADIPPSYSPSSGAPPAADPVAAVSSTSASDGGGGIAGWFKSLKSLPQLLRRVEPLVSPLCQAAAVGSVSQIDGLLAEGANIEGTNEDGNTALICAVLAGHLDTIGHLLDKGAKTTTKDANKVIPPLFHAVHAGRLDVMKLLLDRGADPNMCGTFGNPFFVGAVQEAPIEAIRLLLERGADANSASMTGKHVVVIAVNRGSIELVDLLLSRGAKSSARSPSGDSLLNIAVKNSNESLARLLLDRGDADVNGRSPSGASNLCIAVSHNDMVTTKLLLERGADVDARDPTGQSLVGGCVAKDRDPRILRMLLDHGADLSIRDFSSRTPLAAAVVAGKFDVARVLLEYGGDASDVPGWHSVSSSPLGHCITKGNVDGVRLLLEFRADPNRGDQHGQTPLMLAVSKGKMDFVRLLLDGGGNPNVRNGSGETALLVAVKDGNIDMVRLLLERGAMIFQGPKSAIEVAKKTGRADILRILQSSSAQATSPRNPQQPNQDAPPAYGTQ